MATYKIVNASGSVTNIINWDPTLTYISSSGETLIEISSSQQVSGSIQELLPEISSNSYGGVFFGNVFGSASYAESSSYTSANFNKAGLVTTASVSQSLITSNYIYNITFDTSYESSNYAVSIASTKDLRSWTVENKTSTGFTINSNSIESLTGDVLWMTTEFNS
jgi:hypothetical protein